MLMYMRSMMDCYVIVSWKENEIKREITRFARIEVCGSWKALNGQELQSFWPFYLGRPFCLSKPGLVKVLFRFDNVFQIGNDYNSGFL